MVKGYDLARKGRLWWHATPTRARYEREQVLNYTAEMTARTEALHAICPIILGVTMPGRFSVDKFGRLIIPDQVRIEKAKHNHEHSHGN